MELDNTLSGAYLIGEGAAEMNYSTDKGLPYSLLRLVRIGIGSYLLLAQPEKGERTELIGIYSILESLGSMAISPDKSVPFQIGRAGRTIIGTYYATKKE